MMDQPEYLKLLAGVFDEFNREHFNSRLEPPVFRFGTPHVPSEYGQYENGEIVIRGSLINGDHPHVRAGDMNEEGRLLLIRDVVLHQMTHQFCHERLKWPEINYSGHGPEFRDQCNRIGKKLGLPEVRSSKCHKKVRHLISCGVWPWAVRPAGYYLGAFRPIIPTRRNSPVDAIVERIENLTLDDRRELFSLLASKKLL